MSEINYQSVQPCADSVDQFCVDHNISKATFYNLLKEGTGPETFKVRNRRLVSKEAGARWRKKWSNLQRRQQQDDC